MRFAFVFVLMTSMIAFAFGQTPEVKAETAKLATLKKSFDAAKAKLNKSPMDSKVRSAFVASAVRYGTASMYSPALAARVKYRQALTLYREALAIDPKNKEALANKKIIEDIYRQMGRPIPKE